MSGLGEGADAAPQNEDDQVVDILDMSDEDFLKMEMPSDTPAEQAEPVEPAPAAEASGDNPGAEAVSGEQGGEGEDNGGESGDNAQAAPGAEAPGADGAGAGEKGAEGGGAKPTTEEQPKAPDPVQEPGAVVTPGSEEKVAPAPLNFAAIGEEIMKPFKANGKMVELKTPEEAIKLMQMGAHFTQKMQALQPHRKALAMLENNGLLDEDRLSFLIDLEKGNPDAIKKLIKDSKVDVLDIDQEAEPNYVPGSHKVTDAEVNYRAVLEDLGSTPEGAETLRTLSAWDQASMQAAWEDPSLMTHIHDQRQSGVYDRINAEVERRRTLGQITPGTPFVQAYKNVGQELHQSGALDDLLAAKAPAAQPQPVATAPAPVAVKAAAPKQALDNGDKVPATGAPRTKPTPVKPVVNILAMSDDDFLNQFKGRV